MHEYWAQRKDQNVQNKRKGFIKKNNSHEKNGFSKKSTNKEAEVTDANGTLAKMITQVLETSVPEKTLKEYWKEYLEEKVN